MTECKNEVKSNVIVSPSYTCQKAPTWWKDPFTEIKSQLQPLSPVLCPSAGGGVNLQGQLHLQSTHIYDRIENKGMQRQTNRNGSGAKVQGSTGG